MWRIPNCKRRQSAGARARYMDPPISSDISVHFLMRIEFTYSIISSVFLVSWFSIIFFKMSICFQIKMLHIPSHSTVVGMWSTPLSKLHNTNTKLLIKWRIFLVRTNRLNIFSTSTRWADWKRNAAHFVEYVGRSQMFGISELGWYLSNWNNRCQNANETK